MPAMRALPLVALTLALAGACAPNPQAPVKVMAVTASASNAYGPNLVELKTIESITEVRGKVATFIGGARVVVDPNDPLFALNNGNPTEEQLITILLKDQGGPVRANFITKKDEAGTEVLWPADFHTWNMVSSYFLFENSYLYFQQILDGAPSEELLAAKVLYWASYKDRSGGKDEELVDNAAFFSPIKSFVLVPFNALQKVPLAMNQGVIGHEYGHWVFHKKVYAGAAVPPQLTGWVNPAANILRALDEGFADFHGWGITCMAPGPGCKPNFVADSLSSTTEVSARDLSSPTQCMTETLRNAVKTLDNPNFRAQSLDYRLGTLFAAALYQAGNRTGKVQVVQKALLAAYDDSAAATPGFRQQLSLNLNTQGNFTLGLVGNVIVSHITDMDLRRVLCGELIDRLQLPCTTSTCKDLMPACPDTTISGTSCPVLPPENP